MVLTWAGEWPAYRCADRSEKAWLSRLSGHGLTLAAKVGFATGYPSFFGAPETVEQAIDSDKGFAIPCPDMHDGHTTRQ